MEENSKNFKRSRVKGTISVVLFLVIVIIAMILLRMILK
jgi:hypothetical protein